MKCEESVLEEKRRAFSRRQKDAARVWERVQKDEET